MEPRLYQHNRCFVDSHSCAINYYAVEERTQWGKKNQDLTSFNTSSSYGDQQQFAPNDIHTLSRD